MKTNKELVCIGCPMGCAISVELKNGSIDSISGYACPRGKSYAEKELTCPERTVTSTVPVDGGLLRMAPVKTERDIPKDKIFACMEQIHRARLNAPVKTGEIIIKNIAGTGTNLVATRSVEAAR